METGKWVKSAKSANQGACVEVLRTATEVLVRDSKHRLDLVLSFTFEEWDAFLSGAKGGEFDL